MQLKKISNFKFSVIFLFLKALRLRQPLNYMVHFPLKLARRIKPRLVFYLFGFRPLPNFILNFFDLLFDVPPIDVFNLVVDLNGVQFDVLFKTLVRPSCGFAKTWGSNVLLLRRNIRVMKSILGIEVIVVFVHF